MRTLLFTGILLLLCGCAVTESAGDSELPTQKIGREIITAVQHGDYARFQRYAGETAKRGERQAFEHSCAQLKAAYGEIRSFRFLTTLKTPLAVNQLYVVGMEQPGREGKPVVREMVFQLLLGQTDGKWRVLGMRFI